MIEITQNYESSVNLLFIQSLEKQFSEENQVDNWCEEKLEKYESFSWQISGKGAGSLEKILGTFVRKEMF